MTINEHPLQTARDDLPHRDNHPRHEQLAPREAESAHNLLAVDDPSRRRPTRQAPRRAGVVTMQWLRPTELATQVASRTAARAITAHTAAHLQARAELRAALSRTRDRTSSHGRLAPLTAFGRHASPDSLTARRSGMSR